MKKFLSILILLIVFCVITFSSVHCNSINQNNSNKSKPNKSNSVEPNLKEHGVYVTDEKEKNPSFKVNLKRENLKENNKEKIKNQEKVNENKKLERKKAFRINRNTQQNKRNSRKDVFHFGNYLSNMIKDTFENDDFFNINRWPKMDRISNLYNELFDEESNDVEDLFGLINPFRLNIEENIQNMLSNYRNHYNPIVNRNKNINENNQQKSLSSLKGGIIEGSKGYQIQLQIPNELKKDEMNVSIKKINNHLNVLTIKGEKNIKKEIKNNETDEKKTIDLLENKKEANEVQNKETPLHKQSIQIHESYNRIFTLDKPIIKEKVEAKVDENNILNIFVPKDFNSIKEEGEFNVNIL